MDINDNLMTRAKRRAARERVPLREIMERALRAYLSTRPAGRGSYSLHWKTVKGRVMPGVNLDDRDSLMDAMEDLR